MAKINGIEKKKKKKVLELSKPKTTPASYYMGLNADTVRVHGCMKWKDERAEAHTWNKLL